MQILVYAIIGRQAVIRLRESRLLFFHIASVLSRGQVVRQQILALFDNGSNPFGIVYQLKEEKSMLNNKVYDVLKWITLVVLPALGTLYFALSGIWGFPYGEQIVGTITAVTTFLGICLGVSTSKYNKAVR